MAELRALEGNEPKDVFKETGASKMTNSDLPGFGLGYRKADSKK